MSKNFEVPRGITREQLFEILNTSILRSIVGDSDRNLKIIEQVLDLNICHAHNGLILKGQDSDVALGKHLLNQFINIIDSGGIINPDDIPGAISYLAADKEAKLEELFHEQITIGNRKISIVPKNPRQVAFLKALKANDILFGIGPAGTGKTYLAIALALSALFRKQVNRVILCRPAVEAGEKLGFLPGDMAEKVNPYLRPLYDALVEIAGNEKIAELTERGLIEVAPLAFMRGRTLQNSFVILDEAQNTTSIQMKMFLTRLGKSSKFIVTGDISQIDLNPGIKSGLVEATKLFRSVKGIEFVTFEDNDVVRHPLVIKILQAYQNKVK
jgi:phosphate starvation-inducible protein PhoH and related proteins